ncbi:hypothetical protein SAMN05421503_2273 [Terribacillus aidingensis]|uniref:Permuted papain-like amidase enzyme, YaeF/YiiX, C92 family n=1 Tax=Terribacillus aidingensis TaxID=586416 RepID=A0A285NXK8_9BACI|nr:hypothetical protein [Terribacillus aidingensis]SNZ14222.1 hypothetical protein SAMN05421503_2273 [Terribacillus aidingensis]
MKKFISVLLATIFTFTLLLPMTANAAQTSDSDYEALYNQAIQEGIVNKEELSLEEWLKQNEEFQQIYDDGVNDDVLDPSTLKYGEWLKLNNYGQEPKDEDNDQVVTFRIRAKSTFTVRPGDIFITNSTSGSGIVGHAAIANGSNHILDMPGVKRGKSKKNNNRQLTVSQWLSKYDNGWIKVYRIKDKALAAQVAKYADRHYYSSKGTATKDIHIDYGLTPHLYSLTPSYCSKLVYDAYYYGSGSKNVMKKHTGYVFPYDLVTFFNRSYKPSKVHTY